MPAKRSRAAATMLAGCAALVLVPLAGRAATIMETLRASPDFARTAELIEAAGLAETLSGPGPFTLFAPLDTAYEPANGPPNSLLDPAARDALRALMAYHVVPGRALTGSDLHNGVRNEYETLSGTAMVVNDTANGVQIGDSTVKRVDVEADNGIIQGVSRVFLPPGSVTGR